MSAPGVLVAVTDHAVERFRQRVAGRLDPRTEIAARVGEALQAGRVEPGERGARLVRDVRLPSLVYVCMEDRPRGDLRARVERAALALPVALDRVVRAGYERHRRCSSPTVKGS